MSCDFHKRIKRTVTLRNTHACGLSAETSPPTVITGSSVYQDEEDFVCDTHTTVIVTAFIVSLVHIGLACAGYFFWRWHKNSFERSRALIQSLRSQPTNPQMFLAPSHPMNYQYLQSSKSRRGEPVQCICSGVRAKILTFWLCVFFSVEGQHLSRSALATTSDHLRHVRSFVSAGVRRL